MRGRCNRGVVVGAAVLVVLSGAVGWVLHRVVVGDLTRDALEKLQAVTRLKVDQVVEWRQQLLGDVQANATGRFGMLVQEAARRGFDAGSLTLLSRRMEERQAYRRYRDQVLLGPSGDLVIRLRKDLPDVSEETRSLARRALTQRQALLGEPRLARLEDPVLEAACPVPAEDGAPLGVLVHQEDLDRLLFPLLESWPLPSRTAETQIVMREGDEVLVLSRQRNRSDPPLTRRIPLAASGDLRVRAVLGARGPLTGHGDDPARPLFGHASAIPSSPWVLVAWMEQDEVLARARWFGALVCGMVLLAMAVIAVVAWAWCREGQVRRARRMLEGERLRRLAQEALRGLPDGGDGVLVTDLRGHVTQMNVFAERLTGWPGEEARGRPVTEILPLEDAEEDPEEGSGEPGQPGARSGGTRTARLVCRDGRVRPIWFASVPMRGEDGAPLGFVWVLGDRTGQDAIRTRYRDIESRYRRLFDTNLLGIAWLDAEGRVLEANETFCDLAGRFHSDLEGMAWQSLVVPADRQAVQALLDRLFSGLREPVRIDLRYPRPGGGGVTGLHQVEGIREAGNHLVSILVQVQRVSDEPQRVP